MDDQPDAEPRIRHRCDRRAECPARLDLTRAVLPPGPRSAMVTRSLDAIAVREPVTFDGREGGHDEPSEQGHRCKEGACIAPAGSEEGRCRRTKTAPAKAPRRPRTVTPTKDAPPTKKAVPTKNAQAAKKPAQAAKSGGPVNKETTGTKKAAPAAPRRPQDRPRRRHRPPRPRPRAAATAAATADGRAPEAEAGSAPLPAAPRSRPSPSRRPRCGPRRAPTPRTPSSSRRQRAAGRGAGHLPGAGHVAQGRGRLAGPRARARRRPVRRGVGRGRHGDGRPGAEPGPLGPGALAVEEIDYATVRVADKTYGYCERCFQPIPKPRLRALPYARLCVACKSGGLSRR